MKIRKKNLAVAAILLFLAAAVYFASLSFSRADEDGSTSGAPTVSADTSDLSRTNIDNIIEYSNGVQGDKDKPEDKIYKVVEISSSENQSQLADVMTDHTNDGTVTASVFREYVLGMYKVIANNFGENEADKNKLIRYTVFHTPKIGDVETVADLAKAIDEADLVYVYNDPGHMFSASNDLPAEQNGFDIKEMLRNMVTAESDGRPLMIDSYNEAWQQGHKGNESFNAYISSILSTYQTTKRVYSWKNSDDAAAFMNNSTYLPIHGDSKAWSTLPGFTDSNYVAKILTIQNSSDDRALTNHIQKNITTDDNHLTDEKLKDMVSSPTDSTALKLDSDYIYKLNSDTSLYSLGYASRERKPDYVQFDTINLSDANAALTLNNANLGSYDFIIIENGVGKQILTADQQNFLTNIARAGVTIAFDSQLNNGDKIGESTAPEDTSVNYKDLLSKVSNNDLPQYDNVLITGKSLIDGYVKASTKEEVDTFAQLLINSTFRHIKGKGSNSDSSSVYTVLEVEPGYPIDTQVAAALNNVQLSGYQGTSSNNTKYHLHPSMPYGDYIADQFQNGDKSLSESKDQNDVNSIVTSLSKNGTIPEYYKWDLSIPKVRHAIGLQNVKVVHMSAAEFNASRKTLKDNYDAIYFGANSSSMKTSSSDGEFTVPASVYFSDFTYDGQTFSGNDITASKKSELDKYVEANMPVIFNSKISAAADDTSKIQSGTNMKAFLDSCKGMSSDSVLWNFNEEDTSIVDGDGNSSVHQGNENVILGSGLNSLNGSSGLSKVTVFTGSTDTNISTQHKSQSAYSNDQLNKCLLTNQRPKMISVSCPTPTYQNTNRSKASYGVMLRRTAVTDTDGKTTLQPNFDGTLTWSYQVADGKTADKNFEAKLYIDGLTGDAPDSKFTDDEVAATATGKKNTLSYTVPDSYFGAFYWKLVVTSTQTGCSTSYSDINKIMRDPDQDKIHIDLLQLEQNSSGDNSNNTLYLCTECQESRGKIKGTGNRYNNTGLSDRTKQGLGSSYNATTADSDLKSSILSVNNASISDDSSSNSNQNISIQDTDGNQILSFQKRPGNDYHVDIEQKQSHVDGFYLTYAGLYYPDTLHDSFSLGDANHNLTINFKKEKDVSGWHNNVKASESNPWYYYSYNSEISANANATGQKKTVTIKSDGYGPELKYSIDNKKTWVDVSSDTTFSFDQYVDSVVLSGNSSEVASKNSDPEISIHAVSSVDGSHPLANQTFNIMSDGKLVGSLTTDSEGNATYVFQSVKFVNDPGYQVIQNIKKDNSSYSYPGSWLGVHEHKFGIVETELNDQGQYTGYDDIAQANWFSLLSDDYDVDLDIMTFQEYDNLVRRISETYQGLESEQVANLSKAYDAASTIYQHYYEVQQQLINGGDYSKNTYYEDYSDSNISSVLDLINNEIDADDADKNSTYIFTLKQLRATIQSHLIVDGNNNFKKDDKGNYLIKGFHNMMNSIGVTDDTLKNYSKAVTNLDQYITGTAIPAIENSSSKVFDMTDNDDAAYLFRHFVDTDIDGDQRDYYDFYSMSNAWGSNQDLKYQILSGFSKLFLLWRNAKIYENYFYQTYRDYKINSSVNYSNGSVTTVSSYSNGKYQKTGAFNMSNCYNTLSVGAYEASGNGCDLTEDSCYTILDFIQDNGNVLMFHDTISKTGSNKNMSSLLASAFGQSNSKLTEVGYLLDHGADKNSKFSYHKFTNVSRSDMTLGSGDQFYSSFDMLAKVSSGKTGMTNRAKQNNSGVVTLYPFTISQNIDISATVSNQFPVEISNDDVTVYYSLAGGIDGSASQLYASDPMNGEDNFFLYQFKNVTYTGAGHATVTGRNRYNDDERKLFINVLVNSVRKNIRSSSLDVYDNVKEHDDSNKHNSFIRKASASDNTGDAYSAKLTSAKQNVADGKEPFRFSYVGNVDTREGVQITQVRIYVDMNHKSGSKERSTYDNGDHLLYDWKSGNYITSGAWNQVGDLTTLLNTNGILLQPDWFVGDYCYIVIEMYDTQNYASTPLQKRIRIEKADELYDLN